MRAPHSECEYELRAMEEVECFFVAHGPRHRCYDIRQSPFQLFGRLPGKYASKHMRRNVQCIQMQTTQTTFDKQNYRLHIVHFCEISFPNFRRFCFLFFFTRQLQFIDCREIFLCDVVSNSDGFIVR